MLGPPFERPDDPTGVVIAQPACVEHGLYPWRGTPRSCSSKACATQSLIGRSWARALWRTRRIRLLGSFMVKTSLASGMDTGTYCCWVVCTYRAAWRVDTLSCAYYHFQNACSQPFANQAQQRPIIDPQRQHLE